MAEGGHFEYVWALGIEHNKNCILVSVSCCEIRFQRVYTSFWDTVYIKINGCVRMHVLFLTLECLEQFQPGLVCILHIT